jgi:hypothetical protein
MIKQKLSDYQQSMYNFLSPTASFIAVCAIMYALIVKGIVVVPEIGILDIVIISLASFRLIRLFCFDSILNYLRDRIAYNITVVEEEGGKFVHKTPVGTGYRRLIVNLLDCVWCVGIWTTIIAFIMYIASSATALLVVILAIAGVATFFQLLASLIATHYEACDMKNDEVRKSLGK